MGCGGLRGWDGGRVVKLLDGIGKVSDGLEKARAFFKNISHLGVRDIKSPFSYMTPYWAPL